MNALYQTFVEMQDSVYFDGYSEMIQNENPEKLNFEFQEFLKMFTKKVFKKSKKH